MLRDISTAVATLIIKTDEASDVPDNWTDHMVRCAVQGLLKEMNQSTLAKLSPLSQSAISNIANWKYSNTLSAEKCREFGKWYKQFRNETHDADFLEDPAVKETRLTFHPQHEVPLLRQWYARSRNPNDNKLYFYANELNKGHVRQEKPKVTVLKLKQWWKNERQRERRISARSDTKPDLDAEGSSALSAPGSVNQALAAKVKSAAKSSKRSRLDLQQKQEPSFTDPNRSFESDNSEGFTGPGERSLDLSSASNPVRPPLLRNPSFPTPRRPDRDRQGGQILDSNSSSQLPIPTHFHPTGFVSLLGSSLRPASTNPLVLSDGTVVRSGTHLHSGGTIIAGNQNVNIHQGGPMSSGSQILTGSLSSSLDVDNGNVRTQGQSRSPLLPTSPSPQHLQSSPHSLLQTISPGSASYSPPGAPLERLPPGHWN